MAELSLFDAVRDGAGTTDAVAVSSARGEWTYRELLAAADRLASELDRLCPADLPVVAALTDVAATAVVMLAAGRSGVPVVHIDPTAPEPLAGLRLRDDPAAAEGSLSLALRDGFCLSMEMAVGPSLPVTALPPGHQVFLTSGSTGVPRGVARSSAAMLADADRVAERLGYAAGVAVVASAPVFHVYGFTYALLAPLIRGAPVHHCGWRSLPSQLARATGRTGAHTLIAHPVQYRLLADAPSAARPDFGPLRQAVSAGAALPEAVRAELAGRHRFPLFNCYGSSEAGAVTLSPVSGDDPPDDAGALLPGVCATIRGVAGRERVGELLLRTDSLASGYLTPTGFVPLARQGGGYPTGDLVELVAGRIRLRGRLSHLINVAGKKVNPVEVEQALTGHPAVREAQVFAERDEVRGEVPVAQVVADPGVTVADLLGWCRSRLAPYQLPRRIALVSALPRSATGKPLRPERVGEER